jgi:hypothetical protein
LRRQILLLLCVERSIGQVHGANEFVDCEACLSLQLRVLVDRRLDVLSASDLAGPERVNDNETPGLVI